MPKRGKKTKRREKNVKSSQKTDQSCPVECCTEQSTNDVAFEVFDFYGLTDITKRNVCDTCVANYTQAEKEKAESNPKPVAIGGRRKMREPCPCPVEGCTEQSTNDVDFEVFDFYGLTDMTKRNVCDTCVAKYTQVAKEKAESNPKPVATGGRRKMREPSSEIPPGYYTYGSIGYLPPSAKASPSGPLIPPPLKMDSGKWPEFNDVVAKMFVGLKSDSNRESWESVVDARFLLVDSFLRHYSEPVLEFIEFPVGDFASCFFNLAYLTVNCVKYKTWNLATVLRKTKQLKGLTLINMRWEEEKSDDPNLVMAVPEIPTLKYIQLQNHQVDESYLDYDVIYATQKILRRPCKNLKHLIIDGHIRFHSAREETDKEFYRKLEILEISYLNSTDFGKSPLAFAPLQRLVIHDIHNEEEDATSIKKAWSFISKFAGTLTHLTLDTASLWPDNASKRFQPRVSFPAVKTLELSCPKEAEDFVLLRKMSFQRFPALEVLKLLDASRKFDTNEFPTLAELVYELGKKPEGTSVPMFKIDDLNFNTSVDQELFSQELQLRIKESLSE